MGAITHCPELPSGVKDKPPQIPQCSEQNGLSGQPPQGSPSAANTLEGAPRQVHQGLDHLLPQQQLWGLSLRG